NVLLGWIAPQPVYAMSADNPKAALGGARVAIVATGQSQGPAFQLQVLSPPERTISIVVPDGLVVQALREPGPPATSRAPALASVQTLRGYCLNFAKLPPLPGLQYRIGNQALQEQYAPIARVIRAANNLAADLRLHADTEPAAYADSITQLAI